MMKTVGALLGVLLCMGITGFGSSRIAQARMLGNPVTDTVNGGSGFKIASTSNALLGAYGGTDYVLTPEFRIGGEIHLIFEQGWALYGLFKF